MSLRTTDTISGAVTLLKSFGSKVFIYSVGSFQKGFSLSEMKQEVTKVIIFIVKMVENRSGVASPLKMAMTVFLVNYMSQTRLCETLWRQNRNVWPTSGSSLFAQVCLCQNLVFFFFFFFFFFFVMRRP